MEDLLMVGDNLIADEFAYDRGTPDRDDVMVFIYPGDGMTLYIKRCVGLPGDTIEIRDKVVWVNGTREQEPPSVRHFDTTLAGDQRVQPRQSGGRNSRDNFGPYVVPPDNYFVLGDNRDNSHDSRFWGCVPRAYLVARAEIVVYNEVNNEIFWKDLP